MDSIYECEELIGYHFTNKELIERALTHSSVKSPERPSNERLEFLGDAILGVTISEHLFLMFPDYDEGDLTRMKSVIVSSEILARVVKEMQLGGCVAMGKGILNRKAIPRSILANLYEALVAAIYLDSDMESAKRFILKTLHDEIEIVINDQHVKNFKSLLQQLAQRKYATTPCYHVVREEGPDHMKSFEISATLNGRKFKTAWGSSKKEAEQNAAREALKELEELPDEENEVME